jgi:nucleoside-diphosphate-sugar epimerase
VVALSRQPRANAEPGTRWIVGDLHAGMPPVPAVDVIYSLGPLDAFARWFAHAHIAGAPRIVALGSMSIDTKRQSVDAEERALAARLQQAEDTLVASADARSCHWTLLRPTLIYGAGVDRSLTPIVRFARRWRVFPHIGGARGLRQPVHADDLAVACIAVAASAKTAGRIYPLGGAERLTFAAMLGRVRASMPVRCLPLPIPLGLLLTLRPRLAGAIGRLRQDLVADNAAAHADFGWSPRAFHPTPHAWEETGPDHARK